MTENTVTPVTEDQETPENVRMAVLGSHLAGFRNMLQTFENSEKMKEVFEAAKNLVAVFNRLTETPEQSPNQASLQDHGVIAQDSNVPAASTLPPQPAS